MAKISSVCVFCGSSTRAAPKYLDCAAEFGRLCANAGITVVFGGGRIGLMGALADGALAAGGEVIGVIPHFLDQVEIAHRDTTEIIITNDMHERKAKMAERADAFVVMPGSIGTLEETFEVMTWKQLRQINKPIVIANIFNYWQPIIDLLDHMMEEEFLSEEHRGLVDVVEHTAEILPALGIGVMADQKPG
jgi:uncharacterized protein (TIGR00730 family)